MLFVVLLLACSGDDPSALDSGAGEDSGAPDCALLTDLELPVTAKPGESVAVGVEVDPAADLSWEPSIGEVEGAEDPAWQLPADIAVHVDEVHQLELTARMDGCEDVSLSAELTVGWEDADRVVVVSNPAVEGSADVAQAYAELHDLSAEQLCAIETEATVTLDGVLLPSFLDELQACIAVVGEQVHYVVPVYGVPYKLSGIIDDISGSGSKATVSLDALMVFGAQGSSYSQAIYNPAWLEGDSLAGDYDPWVPFGVLREDELDDPYYLVSRMDGASADAALELVARAREAAELAAAGALDGVVYVDGRYGDTPPATDDFGSYESGEWNMWGTRYLFEELDWYEVVWDGNSEEFGTEPAPTDCPDALYYTGWYSYYNYNDCFTWALGAIGGHLDSCSACDIRAEGTWSGSALERGITATFGAVNEPYVAGMPEYDQLFRYLTEGASYGEAAYLSTRISLWMMVFVGDPLYRPYPAL